MATINAWILTDIKNTTKQNRDVINTHIIDPSIHYSIRSELDMLKGFINNETI